MENKPKNLLRFYGKTEYALQCLEEKKLALPRASKLNDPFDPPLYFLTDITDSNLIVLLKNTEDRLRNIFIPTMFIASFSEGTRDDLYMWGHYANGHRGIAIEFNWEQLNNCLTKLKGHEGGGEFFKVSYASPYVFTNKDVGQLRIQGPIIAEKMRLMFRTKTDNWKRENEWRFMVTDKDTSLDYTKIDLADDVISAVYIGCAAEEKVGQSVYQQTKRNFPNAKVFLAKKRKDKLAIEFEEINP